MDIDANKIVLYGFGEGGRLMYDMYADKISIVAICDSFVDGDVQYKGVPVVKPEMLSDYEYDKVVIASTYVDDIKKNLAYVGVDDSVVMVYDVVSILVDKAFYDIFIMLEKYRVIIGGQLSQRSVAKHILYDDSYELNMFEGKLLYTYLLSKKMFSDAVFARRYLQSIVVGSMVSSTDMLIQKILCFLDLGDYSKVIAAFKSHGFGSVEIDVQNYLRLLHAMYIGNREYILSLIVGYRKDDQLFCDLVADKIVAFVGPCEVYEESGVEIDACDCVVRMFTSLTDNDNSKYIGSKTDIIYVSGNKINTAKTENLDLLDEDVFFVFEKQALELDALKLEVLPNKKRMTLLKVKEELFNGACNGMQRILIDLLMCGVKNVKVYNFDLFASDVWYKKSVVDFYDDDSYAENKILNSQAVFHDFMSQFNFCKALWHAGFILPDMRLAEVLSCSQEEYYKRLQCSFS